MSPLAKRQLLQAIHLHYRSASRSEQTKILDGFTTATGYHRKDAVSLLRHGPPPAEERNGAVIRRVVGYDRHEDVPATTALNAVYDVLRLWINFFPPSMRLIAKQRVGTKVHKRYDQARAPYQRVLDSPAVSAADKQALQDLYLTLNPISIRDELDHRLQRLWALRSE